MSWDTFYIVILFVGIFFIVFGAVLNRLERHDRMIDQERRMRILRSYLEDEGGDNENNGKE